MIVLEIEYYSARRLLIKHQVHQMIRTAKPEEEQRKSENATTGVANIAHNILYVRTAHINGGIPKKQTVNIRRGPQP